MKKKLLKDSFKEIKNTIKRFISLMLIVLLGVGFFSGIKATSPNMKYVLDKYFDEQNVMDLEIVSTMGLTDKDIEELEKIEEIEKVVTEYTVDAILETENKDYTVKIHSITENINELTVLKGRMPENDDECVIEKSFFSNSGTEIGTKIKVEPEDLQNEDGENIEMLKNKELTIVGMIQSPLYISMTRPTTKLGSGQIDYYMYVPENNINKEIGMYTNLYLTVKEAKNLPSYSDKYLNLINTVEDKIDSIVAVRENERYSEIKEKLENKIEDAQKKLDEELKKANSEINDADEKIKTAKKSLDKGKQELKNNKNKAESEFAQAQIKINEAKEELSKKEIEFNNKKTEAENTKHLLNNQLKALNELIGYYNETISNSNDEDLNSLVLKLESVKSKLKQIGIDNSELNNQIDVLIQSAKNTPEEYKETIVISIKKDFREGLLDISNELSKSISSIGLELKKGEEQLNTAQLQLKEQESVLKQEKDKAQKEFTVAENKLNTSEATIKDSEKELEEAKTELEKKTEEANKELQDAREQLAEIKKPKWYVLDRDKNAGYIGYIQDSDRIENISKVFPIVFFVVAALISLNAMTRMVEEQRSQIGTLKALGYEKYQIAAKYILYATLATILGSILGAIIGFSIIPKIIINMYSLMYSLPKYSLSFEWIYAIIGFILATICTVGATVVTCIKELSQNPAKLMRPKSPKSGKRVILEHIPFIWKKLKFTQKVTVRNLFRYKKRFLMTIIGISGCCALILAGFGIRDSVSNMIPAQYGEIFKYDFEITLKDGLDYEEAQEKSEELIQNEKVDDLILLNINTATILGNEEEDVNFIVINDTEKIKDYVEFENRKNNKEKYNLENDSVIMTEKVSNLLNIHVGDTIKIKDNNDDIIEVKVGAITENYLHHYVYMSSELYKTIYGYSPKVNSCWGRLHENINEDEEKELGEIILNNKDLYSSVTFLSTAKGFFSDIMDNMGLVAWVLVISAGLLAFVVLYNLSNLNISERIRELATIKVLGFYDKEVYKYVTREVVILTVIGILIGLIVGTYLTIYIMKTCELDMLMFNTKTEYSSYIIAAGITVIFSVIINWITYFALKKVDMIESLKSVE